MKVQDVMTSNVKHCHPETNLAAVATTMFAADCGVLPVVNADSKVIGMITDRDIAIAVATKGRLAADITVSEVISGKVYSCTWDEDLRAALKTMRHEKIRRLPVTDAEGRLQGILCLNDLILRAEEDKGRHLPDISYEDAMGTLKAISEHRSHLASAHAA